MSIDEIVYTREALRRELVAQLEMLEKAAASYDPAEDVPQDDFIVAMSVVMPGPRHAYANAVSERITQRAEARGIS